MESMCLPPVGGIGVWLLVVPDTGHGQDVADWRRGEEGIAEGGAVASQVDGVHDGESAADAEGEAEEEAYEGDGDEGHLGGV